MNAPMHPPMTRAAPPEASPPAAWPGRRWWRVADSDVTGVEQAREGDRVLLLVSVACWPFPKAQWFRRERLVRIPAPGSQPTPPADAPEAPL